MKRSPFAVLAAAALALSACGGGSSGEEATDSGPVAINIMSIGVSAAAPVEIALREGFFEEEGLDAKITYAEPPAAVPAVMSGDAQFAFLNAPAVLTARSNDVPVVAVAGISVPNPDPAESYLQLLVKGDSDLQKPADLEGRTVAVDVLYQLPDLSLRHALRTAGVDPASVEFVEMPFPQMVDALMDGKVDAINAAEPFVGASLAAGARPLLSATEGQDDTWPHSVMLTSQKYLEDNGDVVDRFARAIAKADYFARENDDEVRTVVPEFTQVPADVAGKIRLPLFESAFEPAGWEAWVEVLAEEELLGSEASAEGAYYTP